MLAYMEIRVDGTQMSKVEVRSRQIFATHHALMPAPQPTPTTA